MSIAAEQRPVDGSDKTTLGLDLGAAAGISFGLTTTQGNEQDGTPKKRSRTDYLQIAVTAESQAITFIDGAVRARWVRSMKAFHNAHFEGSKYLTEQWRGRSKLFRPKTRVAVRKHCRNVAKALFGPGNVVAVLPQDEANKAQEASAAIKQELMNYRLSRTSRRNGIRWFQIVIGARQDSLIHGICISKQSWRYIEEPAIDDYDQPIIDEQTGQQKQHIIEDRPEVFLYPPENVLFSENCDWTNPAQSTEVLILRNSMTISEVMAMVKSGQTGPVKFDDDVDEQMLRSYQGGGNTGSSDTVGTRSARHDGNDPKQQSSTISPAIWLNEVFVKLDGRDMVYWTLGKHRVISEPVPVRRAYPAQQGDRPVVIGFGSIEAHRAYPMSPVESWQPIQQEVNDQVNLRLDHMKQVVTPLAKVKRGRNIDIKAVQSRGGNNGVILVQDKDDLDWAQIPDLPQSAYVENNYLNADFDDIAGTFNTGSVQTNRSLNETVGGMKILAGDANDSGDFDTTIFTETWVEPVAWQILKCIEYYETDATVLAIAGQKAQLIERFGVNEITDVLLMAETQLNVKLGMGVTNLPQERLQKFAMGAKIFGEIAAPFIEKGSNKMPALKMKELANTIFGDAGIPDAADRFFTGLDDEPAPPQQGPPPEQAAMQAKLQGEQAKLQMQNQANQQEMQMDRERMAMEKENHQQEMQMDREKFQHEQNMRQQDQIARHQQQQAQLHTQGQMAQQKLAHGDMQARQKLVHGNMQMQQKAQAQQMPAEGGGAAPAPAQGGDNGQLAQAIAALIQSNIETQQLLRAIVGQQPQQMPMGAQ